MLPRVSFIIWMAIQEWLNTADRLQLFGLSSSPNCPFCQYSTESHSHLFFDCIFTAKIWETLKGKCNVNWPNLQWPHILTFAVTETKGKSLRSIILKLTLLCSVYHIWLERSNIIFHKELKPEEVIIKSIIHMIRGRILSITNLSRSTGDNWYMTQWNLPNTILKPLTTGIGGLLSVVRSL